MYFIRTHRLTQQGPSQSPLALSNPTQEGCIEWVRAYKPLIRSIHFFRYAQKTLSTSDFFVKLALLSFLVLSLPLISAEHTDGDVHEHEPQHMTAPQDIQAPAEQHHEQPSPHTEGWTTTPQEPPHDTPFRGNWFKKRALVQDMRVLHENIHEEVQKTWEPLHKQFFETYGPAREQLQAQGDKLGFSAQTITEVETGLQTLSETVSTGSARTLSPSPHLLPSTSRDVAQVQALLKELRESLKILDDIAANITTALAIAQNQAPLGQQLEQQAWKYYEDIDAAYDDQHAAQLYEEIRAKQTHLHELQNYLQGQLAPYINHIVGQYDATLRHVETVYNALIKQGVVLRSADIPRTAPPPLPKPTAQPSWWQKLLGWLTAPFYAIGSWVKSLFGWK